jgi:hypothetical protein
MATLSHLLPYLLFAATAAAQTQAAFVPFGAGCPFAGQTPTIGNQGLPQLGTTCTITYAGPNHTFNSAQQIAWPQLALGFTPQQFLIPAGLFPQQPANCLAELAPLALVPTQVNAIGNAFDTNVDIRVPNDPGMIGVVILAQWVVLHEQCGFAGCGYDAVLTSDAAQVVLGV